MVFGIVGQQIQKGMEVRGGGVVGAGRTHDVDLFKSEFCFQRAQCVDLTGNSDYGEALETARPRRLQQRQQRCISHPHAAALRHAIG